MTDPKSDAVKRYSMTIQGLSSNWPVLAEREDAEGAWVRYEDYTALQQQLLALTNILALCGEEECRDVKGYPEKLRALIDGLVKVKQQLKEAHLRGFNEAKEAAANAIEDCDEWDMHQKDYARLVRRLAPSEEKKDG